MQIRLKVDNLFHAYIMDRHFKVKFSPYSNHKSKLVSHMIHRHGPQIRGEIGIIRFGVTKILLLFFFWHKWDIAKSAIQF